MSLHNEFATFAMYKERSAALRRAAAEERLARRVAKANKVSRKAAREARSEQPSLPRQRRSEGSTASDVPVTPLAGTSKVASLAGNVELVQDRVQ